MYQETLELVAESAKNKAKLCSSNLLAYLMHAAMAGIYLGFGVVLVFSLTTSFFQAESPGLSLVMGTTFGIALSLVVIAGADLFTGNTMIMLIGALKGKTTWTDLSKIWFWSYCGNFLGAIIFALIAWKADVLQDASWLLTVATKKMNGSWMSLFLKRILCNWLVVLAVWCSFKLKTEGAKLIMIWWCLLGFVGSGYEHSIANMTLLTLANLLPNDGIHIVSWSGVIHNLIPVTLGNIVSGVLFMGIPYYFISYPESVPKQDLRNY
ncbi:MAG TPA: formate/nitrite transporter family protein [Gammaproteobacteria bacterium]|nr:formate/nitrite transporter family protein [Gammaproteobacteria bacterium]